MVQIPEYTRRDNAQPMQRGGMNINLPGAFTQPAGLAEAGKKAFKLSSEMADVFVNMKERRDDGIVSAFVNQYDKDSTAKMLQLKDQYQGQEAYRIMPEFQKWRDEYIAQHSSYDEDNAKEGVIYLEDEAQNRIAKQKLDAYNVRDINSLSAYIAREEETFRVNSLNTSIKNGAAHIIDEDNPMNVASLKASIYMDVASLHKGQSKEFINSAAQDILDAALSGNIMRDSASNPMASIDRFETPEFSDELTTKSKQELKEKLLKSFKDYQAIQLANAQAGRPSSPAGEDFYSQHTAFFGKSLNSLKEEINEESIKQANKILEKDDRERTAVLKNLTLQLIDAQSKKDAPRLAQTLSAMSGIPGGLEMAALINEVDTGVNDYSYLKKAESLYRQDPEGHFVLDGQPVPSYAEVDERLATYELKNMRMAGRLSPVIDGINNDKYKALTDISDFSEFPPYQQEIILTTFARRARYNSLKETAEAKSGIDFSYQIAEVFKSEGRGTPSQNPLEYNRFEYEMSRQIVDFMSENQNKAPEAKDLQRMARNCVTSTQNRMVYDVFSEIAKGIKDLKVKGSSKADTRRDYGTLYNYVYQQLDRKSKGVWRNAAEKDALKRATELFIDNRWDLAYDELANADLMERQQIDWSE